MANCKRIIQGSKNFNSLSSDEIFELIKFDLENGVFVFDVTNDDEEGTTEAKIGQVLAAHPELREQMVIQCKCGDRFDKELNTKYYDLSYENIMQSVNNSLARLQTNYIDVLILTNPDVFLESDEIARAFSQLKQEEKVCRFGLSNFPHETVKYISDQTNIPIDINQLRVGIAHTCLVSDVISVNVDSNEGSMKTSELYFYMKRHGFQIQARDPFMIGDSECVLEKGKFLDLQEHIQKIADRHKTTKRTVIVSFVLKLGPNVAVIVDTKNQKHMQECLDAVDVHLDNAEWYYLYTCFGNNLQ